MPACVFPSSISSRCAPNQTTGDALAATVALAQAADRLGFTRYWVAEYHNMPSVGATSPPVLLAYLAPQTTRLRLGSGGVMLPNHAPLAVAEKFALLEAAAPGRIDIGIGRAPGYDPVTSYALRGGRGDEDIQRFPDYLDDVAALMSARGVVVPLRSGDYRLRATPAAAGEPAAVAAGLVDVLRAPGRRQGVALRVRPSLLRQGNRGGARGLPVAVPAQRADARAAHLFDGQRRSGRNLGTRQRL